MTASRRYVIGLLIAVALGILAVFLAKPSLRKEIAAGELIGLLVQAPLGWWTLQSIGTEKFQLVWLGGMVIRLAVVVCAAVGLAGAGATLLVLLLLEAVTAVREHTKST